MPMTPEAEPEEAEEVFAETRSLAREQIEEIIIAQPIKSLAIALVVGIVIGRFVF